MCYFSGESFYKNKFFLVESRSQFALSLATYAFLFNRCSCLCPLQRHLHHWHPLPLYCFTRMLYYLLTHVLSLQYCYCIRLKKQLVFISQQHTSINNIIVEWIITITSIITTYPIVIPIIIIHISVLMQFMLKRKT